MRCNFKIIVFRDVEFEGRLFDVHNNFDFVTYTHDKDADELKIYFDRSDGEWVPEDEFDKLTFTLSKIHYLKTIDPDPEIPDTADRCLMELTFYYSEDRENDSFFCDREQPDPGDDIIFTFNSGRIIRVNCDTVVLNAEKFPSRERTSSINVKSDKARLIDETVPVSPKTVFLSSIIFGAITGAILLAINLRRLKTNNGIYQTLTFGCLFTSFHVWILVNYLHIGSAKGMGPFFANLGIGAIGATTLALVFWNRYIGKDKKYRSA